MTAIVKENLYSFEEYIQYEENPDNRYELVNGKLELMNPPTFRHILIAKLIERELDKEINRLELPWLAMREGGIRTGWWKSRISDVYVVSKDQIKDSLDESGILFSINEYWIVDPLEQQVTVLRLEEGL